jgi:hypothetical protein
VQAVAAARKLISLDSEDRGDVRTNLILMLLRTGDVEAAARECKADEPGDEYLPGGVARAFVRFTEGNVKGFRAQMLSSLFALPFLRLFVEDTHKFYADDEKGHRGGAWNIEDFAEFARPTLNEVPGLRRAAISLIDESAVVEAETSLRNLWNGFYGLPGEKQTSSREQWDRARVQYVSHLSELCR